jgi:hypothetical protein
MSYCRFSSDNWKSDVYAYESTDGGWVTHVAGNRLVGDIPDVPPVNAVSAEAWMQANRVQHAFLSAAEREKIHHPHAGMGYVDRTIGEFVARLESLQAEGFHVPQFAIDEARAELAATTA